jgi:hypothetical protein
MMGIVRTLPVQIKPTFSIPDPQKYLVVSGSYGNDGMPCDWEDLTVKSRTNLIPVPQEIAEIYWKGEGGWNSSGSEGPTMRKWAFETYCGCKLKR